MTSDVNSGKIPDASLVHGSQATYSKVLPPASGKAVPPAGNIAPTQANKHLNESGRPDQFRLDNSGKLIQQIDPATGAVIGEFAASEFPALARSIGASGLLVDDLA